MKVRVTTNLNVRTRAPRVLPDNCPTYLTCNAVVEIEDVVVGDDYKGNNIWYRLIDGTYIWSGGVSEKIRNVGNNLAPVLARQFEHNLDWWHNDFCIQRIWQQYGTRGRGVEVAVLDSGMAPPMPGKMYTQAFDYANISGAGVNGSAVYADASGHGTQVASVLAANGDIQGVAPECRLFMYKYYTQNPAIDNLIQGIEQIPAHIELVVITSGFLPDNVTAEQRTKLEVAMRKLASRALIFCSVGDDCNHDDNPFDRLPAAFREHVMGIASIDQQRIVSDFSTRSTNIALAAPGENMRAIDFKRDGIYPVKGTSFSAPFAAGVCALAKAAMPTVTIHEIKDALISTLDAAGDPELYGKGIINPLKLFEKLVPRLV